MKSGNYAVLACFVLLFSISSISGPLSTSASTSSSTILSPAMSSFGQTGSIPKPDIGFYTCNKSSPCPMGIADYGVNLRNTTDEGANINQTYTYETNTTISEVNFTSLKIGFANIKGANHQMTLQQNLVDYNVAIGNTTGEYWTQDVPYVQQTKSGYEIYMLDNIWNFSADTISCPKGGPYVGCMLGHDITGNLTGGCQQSGGSPEFYYCLGKIVTVTTLPFTLVTAQVTGVVNQSMSMKYAGDSYVAFYIGVYHRDKLIASSVFDEVAFHSKGVTSTPSFRVGGMNPLGLYNDAETVLCGPGGGSSVNITYVRADMIEMVDINNTGTLTPIPHAFSAGTDTAETVLNVHMSSTNGVVGVATRGNDNNAQLW